MIVPTFWAEGRIQQRTANRQVTIRRYGWSDTSLEDAQAKADQRARAALARFTAGDRIVRREPKVAYNGADGVPIREEIVSRHGPAVITRNLYGARCLNTPDVLFADVDFANRGSLRLSVAVTGLLLATGLAVGAGLHSKRLAFGLGLAALLLGHAVATGMLRLVRRLRGGPEKAARRRIDRFVAAHPDWRVRLYRTPAGFRVLVVHRTFAPADPEARACFDALGTDPVYARMCLNQQCFRARVSPKPWRVGVNGHLRPRPGVWPVDPARLPDRNHWIESYEQSSRNHAACEFIETLGTGAAHPTALAVQRLHDELSRATTGLPIA